MWARYTELLIAGFLLFSSQLFPDPHPLWIFNFITAIWIALFSLLSFIKALQKMHLLNLVAAFALVGFAFAQPNPPPPPPFQNYVVLALLLFMFSILPTNALHPPAPWRRYYGEK